MTANISRRRFLKAGLAGGAGAAFSFPPGGAWAAAAEGAESYCVTLCNHWSYTGIGWQLGLESCVLSAVDAMGMADRAPHVKTCLELDALAYVYMAEKFPEVAERLKRYLADDKVELIGGTYGQPMGTMFSGESNIRQLVYGREAIRKALGYEVATFLDEEEFSHPQIPQMALGAGYRYASLAQVDTWGNAGIPRLEVNAFKWKGLDGSAILSTPKNSLFGYSPDLKKLATSDAFKKLQGMGKPLIFTWEEFGWEPPDEPAYLTTAEKYKKLADESPVEFVTLKDYLDKYGKNNKETVYFNMDAWNKLLTWGLGGDQLRIADRKVEATLEAAERFGAIAFSLGAKNNARSLEQAWKHLLISQSHDVGLCEYSRWQGDRMPPLDRIEDYHNFTWGAIGYNHLDAAQKQGKELLDSSLSHVASHIGAEKGSQGSLTVAVFNPCAWERTDIATTGPIYPIREKAKNIVVRARSGRVVPSQIIKSDLDDQGNLVMADVAFLAEKVPSVGYDTYYLELTSAEAKPSLTDLRIDLRQLELENEHLKVNLSLKNGAIVSLVDKRTGRELINPDKSAFPVFKGTPNQGYCLRAAPGLGMPAIPAIYDSSQSQAVLEGEENVGVPSTAADTEGRTNSAIRWIEKGPLRATVKTTHQLPYLKFETYVTLSAGLPWVEVTCRVLAQIPPAPDALNTEGRFPVEIKQGYWLTFAPAFQPDSVVRDFPLGIEPTERPAFQALTFVDLVGKDAGILVLHPGTQYFKREADGVFSNLIMREWESHFSGEYGWPRYSEYRHALLPHRGSLTNADRQRAADGFSRKLLTMVAQRPSGNLPPRKSFITMGPENAHLMVFRKKERQGYELRLTEVAGKGGDATVQLDVPVAGASETDFLGRKVADVSHKGGKLDFALQPWKVRTFQIR